MEKSETTAVLTKLACLCGECWFHPYCFIARGYDKSLAEAVNQEKAICAAPTAM